jgi:hypothetical protein
VTLDPFPFGGGVTMTDSLSCGSYRDLLMANQAIHVPFVTSRLQTVHWIGHGISLLFNDSNISLSNSVGRMDNNSISIHNMNSHLINEYVSNALQLANNHKINQIISNNYNHNSKVKNNNSSFYKNMKMINDILFANKDVFDEWNLFLKRVL